MTRTEAKRHADAKRASEVAHEALPLVGKTEEAGRGKAAAQKLRLQQSERKEPIAGPSGEPDEISIGTILQDQDLEDSLAAALTISGVEPEAGATVPIEADEHVEMDTSPESQNQAEQASCLLYTSDAADE